MRALFCLMLGAQDPMALMCLPWDLSEGRMKVGSVVGEGVVGAHRKLIAAAARD